MKSKKRVMLIYGGISSEREISIISSIGINESLIRNNYEVIKIDADENLEKEINALLMKSTPLMLSVGMVTIFHGY